MKKSTQKKTAFVTFSGRAMKTNPKLYHALIDAIEKGCNCVIKYRWFESKEEKTPKEIYETSLTSIREADIIIVEASLNSIGVGQQLAYAIQLKKPTIICIDANSDKTTTSSFLKGTPSSNVLFVYYSDLKDLKKRLSTIVSSLERLILEKFNFVATKKQKEFLLEESKKRNISKSELLRMIIDEWIANNDYPRELLK